MNKVDNIKEKLNFEIVTGTINLKNAYQNYIKEAKSEKDRKEICKTLINYCYKTYLMTYTLP